MNKYLVIILAVLVAAGSNSFGRDKGEGGHGKGAGGQSGKADREAKGAERKAQLETAKAEREAKRAEAKTGREDKMAEKKAEREKAREQKAETVKDKNENKASETKGKKYDADKGQEVVDNRETRQDKRIQHGINKGYLTADEAAKLEAQQSSISTLESSLTGDGSLSKQDFKQIQTELNTASHNIWGEKHDTDGNQMAAYRFGKNVFAKSDLTSKMSDPNLSKSEAKKLCGDFKQMMGLKRQLSGDVTGAEREKIQAQYDALLNNYFEVK